MFKRAQQGEVFPSYLCYGTNRSGMNQFSNGLIDLLIPKADQEFAVSRYDMRDVPVQDAIMDAETMPFMTERKLILVEHAYFFTALDKKVDSSGVQAGAEDEQSDEQQNQAETKSGRNTWTKAEHDLTMLTSYLQQPSDFSIVLFLVPGHNLDERKKIVSSLRKQEAKAGTAPFALVPFDPLIGERLRDWVVKNVTARQLRMNDEVMDYFIHLNGHDQAVLRFELDKLALHLGEQGVVHKEHVDLLGVKTFEQNVFQLIEMILQKQTASAHQTLLELLKYPKENNPFLMINLLARQFRTLLMIKDLKRQSKTEGEIASIIGVAPFIIKQLSKHIARYELDQLAEIVSACADLDYACKSGGLEPKLSLEIFVLKLAS
jgi:DNA polymerase-3 subunit delta